MMEKRGARRVNDMRQKNITVLEDTLHILDQGSYTLGADRQELKLSRAQMEAVTVYLPQDVAAIRKSMDVSHVHVIGRCGYGCENADSFRVAMDRYKELPDLWEERSAKPILVLNLANPVHPGGGVRNGAKAQEEDLCRRSSLLLSLESGDANAYYAYNRALDTYMGSDAVMISPQVEIIKDENGQLLPETVIVAVMTCAAPMLKYGMEGYTPKAYEAMVYQRITGMLKVAAYLGYRHLVLGAFGCGAFRNDARVISDLFYKALKDLDFDGMKEHDLFRRIDFAVMDHTEEQYNFKEFARNFTNFYREEDQKPTKETLERLAALKDEDIEYDDDCPELTPQMQKALAQAVAQRNQLRKEQ